MLAVLATVAWFEAPFLLDQKIVVERDALSSILPLRAFLAEALRQGDWPMWNPLPVLGKPFLPEWQTGLFYPPSLFFLVPPFTRGFNLFFVFHYAWTAVGALLLLRALGVSRVAAALGALVWAMGGPLVSLGHLLNHLMAAAWLPWVLWAWVRTEDVRRRVLGSSLLLAVVLLTGSPEMALLIAGLLVILARDPVALVVPPIAGALAAMQLVPVWEYLGLTHRGVHGLSTENVLAYSSSLSRLSQWVHGSGPADGGPFLPSLYVGPVPVVLALAGLVLAPALVRWLAILVGILLFALALGANTALLPLLHAYVPGIDLLRYPEKLLVGVHALVALGAAWGLSRLAERVPARPAVAVALALGLTVVTVADLARVNRDVLLALPSGEVSSVPAIAEAMKSGEEPPSGLVRYYANATGAPPAADATQALRNDRAILYAGTGELYGLANVNTPASLNLLGHEALHRSLERAGQERALATLAALGARWATSFMPLRGPTVREVRGPCATSAALYALGAPEPRRAFIAQRILVAHDADRALARFVEEAATPGTAILEGLGVEEIPYRAPARSEIRWIEAGNNGLTLDVSNDAPALLVLNDTFLGGWRAWIDGRPTSIERVNGIVRGIWLASGRHRVTMRYRAPGLPLGCAISLLALIGLVLATYRAGQYRAL